uniref:Uncharacterized protein n=1 Tax=Picea glauca TaxID=3330 RepID=A0A101M481_PICGL|nr:hypothetical protein ABT39_MTgene653 [Picea glauca]
MLQDRTIVWVYPNPVMTLLRVSIHSFKLVSHVLARSSWSWWLSFSIT